MHEGQRKDMSFKNLSWAIGVLLGRFDAQTGGLVDLADQRRKEQGVTPTPAAPPGHIHGLLNPTYPALHYTPSCVPISIDPPSGSYLGGT